MTVTAPAASTPAVPEPASPPERLALPSGSQPGPEPGRGATTVLGTLMVIAAQAMVLGSILAVYFAIKAGSAAWPPKGVKLGTYVPTVVTVTAVMSMLSMGWVVSAVRRHDARNAVLALVLTVVLGLAMANAQIFALSRAGFGAGKHAYGTLYYMLIGFHIAQLVAGLVMLIVVGVRVLAGHFRTDEDQPVRAAAYYWHWVCVAWFAVMTALFLMSSHARA